MGRTRKADADEPLEARIVDDDEEGDEPDEPAYRAETVRAKRERRTHGLVLVFAALRLMWWGANVTWLLIRENLVVSGLDSRQETPTAFQQIVLATAATHGVILSVALAVAVDQVLRHVHRILDPVPAGPRV